MNVKAQELLEILELAMERLDTIIESEATEEDCAAAQAKYDRLRFLVNEAAAELHGPRCSRK